MRPAWFAVSGSGYEPPPEIAEKAVIPARNELCAVLERCSECGLDGAPMCEHPGLHVSVIQSDSACAVDLVTNSQLRERTLTAIAHERSEEHTSELQSLRHLVCR